MQCWLKDHQPTRLARLGPLLVVPSSNPEGLVSEPWEAHCVPRHKVAQRGICRHGRRPHSFGEILMLRLHFERYCHVRNPHPATP